MPPNLPNQIKLMMAARDWRLHHYLWHQVRNGWLSFDAATQQAIRSMGWEPPRPAQNEQGKPILDNDSGEDFLYMHRQMIGTVNSELARIGDPQYPKVQGWSTVPAPNDASYPVPPAWQTGSADLDTYLKRVKSKAMFTSSFQPWERDYTNPAKLAGWSLGELGARIEMTIHNQMHMRWCSKPSQTGMRPDVNVDQPDTIDPKWDDVKYDWLGDTYSSHVNSVFWQVHGWVDDRIEDWKRAHNVTGEIQWKGKWLGHSPAQPHVGSFLAPFSVRMEGSHAGHHHGSLADMEKMLSVVNRTGRFCHFYDDIKLPE